MKKEEFELLLSDVSAQLTDDVRSSEAHHGPRAFEDRTRELLQVHGKIFGFVVNLSPHPQLFPDIVLGEFGIEVKVVSADSWRTVGNSVFEGMRDPNVKHIYVLYGKMGGTPTVKWGKYEDCVMHVRTSHRPRFELEIGTTEPLFSRFGVTYDQFCDLDLDGKMKLIRGYARGRLKPGEHPWWLENKPEEAQEHSLPLGVRLYMSLAQPEKRRLRAEAALLCPQVVGPSRAKKKYYDAAMYLITYHGVLCSQARDLFSAGSVALRSNQKRGGNYIMRALQDIEKEMIDAAERLDDALLIEYWGETVKKDQRIGDWLRRADAYAIGWKPSDVLFKGAAPEAI
jgi:hypothetical protein